MFYRIALAVGVVFVAALVRADEPAKSGNVAESDDRKVAMRSRGLFRDETPRIVLEIDQLGQALKTYGAMYVSYPPSLADANAATRQVRFMRHLQTAFPNSSYGTTQGNFATLAEALKSGPGARGSLTNQPYNYKNEKGELKPLDLDTLDQAEALVFWLAGFPTPYDTETRAPIAKEKLFGFHRDSDSPFKRDALKQEGANPLRYRTEPLFQFQEKQLVDQDRDGWWEYAAFEPAADEVAAPVVYFDADTYGRVKQESGLAVELRFVGYPRAGHAGAEALARKFGMAVPLAESFDPADASASRWQNVRSFQIVCAGLDGKFSAPVVGDPSQAMRVPVFPAGDVFHQADKYAVKRSYAEEELDNLTNLSEQTLGEARSR